MNKILKRILAVILTIIIIIWIATILIGGYFVRYALYRNGAGGNREIKNEQVKIEEKDSTFVNIMKFDKQIKGVSDLGKQKRFSKKIELEAQDYENLVNYAKKGIVADKEINELNTRIGNLRASVEKWKFLYDELVEKTKDYFHAIKLAPQKVTNFFKGLFDKEKQDEIEKQRIEQEKIEAERKARELARQEKLNSPEYKKRRARDAR